MHLLRRFTLTLLLVAGASSSECMADIVHIYNGGTITIVEKSTTNEVRIHDHRTSGGEQAAA